MNEFSEPWKEGERHESMCYLEGSDGREVVQLQSCKLMDYKLFQSQIDRVRACVNALAGVPTEDIEELVRYGKEYFQR